jgi:hypothetical protein
MTGNSRIFVVLFALAFTCCLQPFAEAVIPADEVSALDSKLAEAGNSASTARKKLAVRRVIKECEDLLEKHATTPNRFEVLEVLFRSQQMLVTLDNSTLNRRDFLATAQKLAAAPNEYAALRLEADLLLTQAEAARKGGDSHARSDALRPLVERYRDTDVEAKVIRIAMIMALEFGNTQLVNDLREVVAQRFPGDMELIQFQREKLSGQVFGAPFIGTFTRSDGKMVKFPMDFLGTTTVIYFWSKEQEGMEDLTALATAWKLAQEEMEEKPEGRLQFVSMNMDNLPDAGEGILRGLGLDWQALKMPGGQDNPIFSTYVGRETPTILTISPTGYAALYLSGGRSDRTYDRQLGSMLARSWAKPRYTSQLQSIYSGEFLVTSPQGDFDPAAPPEYTAIHSGKLTRTAESVPEVALKEIQACFIDPPLRYRTPHEQVVSNYKKADELCRAVLSAHPQAPDLWIVRNRRMAALMGLWETIGNQDAFAAAVEEAKALISGTFPSGTDVLAKLCLARQALRESDAEPKTILNDFVKAGGGDQASGPILVSAILLALDTGDRLLHEKYRRSYLDQHAENRALWTATAFLLDRYHRYWQYHPPFVAGWTYGRRQGYFLSDGSPEDANRTLEMELRSLDGELSKVPGISEGKWTVLFFTNNWVDDKKSQLHSLVTRNFNTFVEERGLKDVQGIVAVLDGEVGPIQEYLKEKPLNCEVMMVPGGIQNPIVRKLGILDEDSRPNLVLLRPDGSIAVSLSGLTMSSQNGNVIENVIELHDEKLIDEALERGDIEEAKRLAFTLAPLEEPLKPGEKKRKPVLISNPHLRSRAKVYLAMGNFQAAFEDAEKAYLSVNSKAGFLAMRTEELNSTEALRDSIQKKLEASKP